MRKKQGHHGGAWKVAYADFVTAMMALFLVLWILGQDSKIKEAIQRVFRHPHSPLTQESAGIMPNKTKAAPGERGNFDSAEARELALLRRLNQDLTRMLTQETETESSRSVQVDMVPEGLRISIFDRSHKPVFQPDSTQFTDYGSWVFSTLAWEISRYSTLNIELEGHTEQGHSSSRPDYGSWELSADRANAARRKLLNHGVQDQQIRKVAGFADTMPMPGTVATDESNRRVTVLLKVQPGHVS
jgi:chemotaxis protein MotB